MTYIDARHLRALHVGEFSIKLMNTELGMLRGWPLYPMACFMHRYPSSMLHNVKQCMFFLKPTAKTCMKPRARDTAFDNKKNAQNTQKIKQTVQNLCTHRNVRGLSTQWRQPLGSSQKVWKGVGRFHPSENRVYLYYGWCNRNVSHCTPLKWWWRARETLLL